MNMIKFINPLTNEIRFIKLGLSWTLFFFYPIVLFMRKIYDLGIIVLSLAPYFWIGFAFVISFNREFALVFIGEIDGASYIASQTALTTSAIITSLVFFIDCGIRAFFLLQGNKLTAKKYIDSGFRVVAENEYQFQQVKISWELPDEAFIKPDKQINS